MIYTVRILATMAEQGRFTDYQDAEDFIDAAMALNPDLKPFDLAVFETVERRIG